MDKSKGRQRQAKQTRKAHMHMSLLLPQLHNLSVYGRIFAVNMHLTAVQRRIQHWSKNCNNFKLLPDKQQWFQALPCPGLPSVFDALEITVPGV